MKTRIQNVVRKQLVSLTCLCGLAVATGCGSIGGRVVDNRSFAGVRVDYAMCFDRSSIDPECRINPALAVVDAPFSLVGDILFLPYDCCRDTSPTSIVKREARNLSSQGGNTDFTRQANGKEAGQHKSDPQEDFRALLEARRFHEAFLLFPKVKETMRDVPEDAAGNEYQMLMGATAGTGRNEWDAILKDPRSSPEMKRDLRAEIHEDAKR